MNISDFENSINDLIPTIDHSFDFIKDKKSIIICGNGKDGYIENISNKFIDSHDFVVRINNYKTIPKITGFKKDCLYIGSASGDHLASDDFYQEINDFDFLISRKKIYDQVISKKGNDLNLKKDSRSIIYEIDNICDSIYKLGYRPKHKKYISGLVCIFLFYAISKKYNIKNINIIGFSDKKFYNKSYSEYYYGKSNFNHWRDRVGHFSHHWQFQYDLIKLIKQSSR